MNAALVLSRLGVASACAVATLSVTSLAHAGGDWGVHSGDTVQSEDVLPYGEFGWPDISAGLAYGVNDDVDIGPRISIIYGYGYTTNSTLGMELRAPIRISITQGPKISALFHVDPGIKFFQFNPTQFALGAPVGFELGIHLTSAATLQFGLDVPFYVNLTNGAFANFPILAGPAFEYHVDSHIAVGINTRFGPSIFAGNGGGNADFGVILQPFFGYRL